MSNNNNNKESTFRENFTLIDIGPSLLVYEANTDEIALMGYDLDEIDMYGRIEYIHIGDNGKLQIVIAKTNSNADVYRGFKK